MTRLEWDTFESRRYEIGVDHGVFYPTIGPGVPWNGLISVSELESDTSTGKIIFVDGNRYSTELGIGDFAAILSAFTFPDEFEEYDGYNEYGFSNQRRKKFNFSYRTKLADEINENKGYLIHLVYNALATPTERSNVSNSGVIDPNLFSWSISTTPVVIPDARATSHFIIDTTKAYPATIKWLEDHLYGTALLNPSMPTIKEILEFFEANAIFRVTDNGDGTATIAGPEYAVHMINEDTVELTYETVIFLGDDTYQLSSL